VIAAACAGGLAALAGKAPVAAGIVATVGIGPIDRARFGVILIVVVSICRRTVSCVSYPTGWTDCTGASRPLVKVWTSACCTCGVFPCNTFRVGSPAITAPEAETKYGINVTSLCSPQTLSHGTQKLYEGPIDDSL